MKNLVILFKSIKYNLIIFSRIKIAVFFSIAFPCFLFVVFGNIWGGYKDYTPFILSGVLGMVIASDGFFAIGPLIREYYSNGLIKYFQKLPFNILLHFAGLIISRIVTLIFTIILLFILAYFIFGYKSSINEFLHYITGAIIGLTIFSFIGLSLSFSVVKQEASKGLSNLIYFLILFTSMAFYPTKYFNKVIGEVGDFLPLNPILNIIRDERVNYYILLFWLIIPTVVFYITFRRVKFNR
ncbi:ABC transporter permease [Elizabethkingia anophelis]|uniref:ABC transporter permease n=1 Tax=Elizabethkingia anophelis TaxID=1117645 RepID=UPI0009954588|nr:ABC transporter permease [Elizabethkingia anophelis]AQW95512.1 hypothetical protein BBD30_15675 [Elizabethkingia anophelis]MCL1688685.1 ABC transporter permease [Elizabethkingia anophelis]MDV3566845.1 ABC transporter permease [Elizabethkingia anophelis]MDV3751982.1 ABC transporter permease [Elizabethkingia anophelis]MDV3854349.1 ABC transporter permease [Elizabethkingia anophelis]